MHDAFTSRGACVRQGSLGHCLEHSKIPPLVRATLLGGNYSSLKTYIFAIFPYATAG